MLGIGNALHFVQVHTALLLGAVLALIHNLKLHCCGGGGGSGGPKTAEEIFKVSEFVALPNNYTVTRSTGRFFVVNCAKSTCPYGAWLCDRLVEAGQTLLDWDTDIAMYPAASLRGGLPEGPVTTGHLKGLHMAADFFAQVRLTGAAIQQTLLSMLHRYGEQGGKDACFLQTGGLRYKAYWNVLEKAWDLDVVQVWQQGMWRPLDLEAQYNLVTDRALIVANTCNYSHLYEAPGVLLGSQTRVLLFQMLEKMSSISPPVYPMDRACLHTVSCSWSKTVGVALHDFHSHELVCRNQTCSYGIFLAEALLQYGKAAGQRSQIALFNAGSIQSNLEAGEVSWEDIEEVHPYGEMFVYAELPALAIGRVLVKMLNSKGLSSTSGDFMQMAGIRFYAEWDPLLQSWDLGTTQVHVEDSWMSVDMRSSATFRVVLNRFIMRGGDGFHFLQRYPFEVAGSARSVIIQQFLTEGLVRPPEVDDRHCFSTNCTWLPVLAIAEEQLDGDVSSCGDDTCGLGILACEALFQLAQQMRRGPHAVLLRASVFGGSIPPGEITYNLLAEILAEGEAFAETWMTGHEIRRIFATMMLHHGPPGTGNSPNFVQFAGLRMRAIWNDASQRWSLLGVELKNKTKNETRWETVELEAKYRVIVEERLFTEDSGVFQFLHNRWKETLGVLRTQIALYFQKMGTIRAPLDDDRHCFTPLSCRYPSRDDEEAAAAGPMAFPGQPSQAQAPAERQRLLGGSGTGAAVPTLIAVAALALVAAGLAVLASSSRGGSRDLDISGASLLDKDGGQSTAADAATLMDKDSGPPASGFDGSISFIDEEGLVPGSGLAGTSGVDSAEAAQLLSPPDAANSASGAPLMDSEDVPGENGFTQQTNHDTV